MLLICFIVTTAVTT